MAPRERCARRVSNAEEPNEASILQLPELALECILEKLPPAGLCSMAAVCSSLREICTSDRLWERHVRQKWWRLFGPAARREWKFYLPSGKDSPPPPAPVTGNESNRWIGMLSCVSPVGWLRTEIDSGKKAGKSPPDCSIMALYRALENGQFWLPAQVYNREHGHAGYLLSCYDAEISYDRRTHTFRARYPPQGRRRAVVEDGVEWDRLRAPPIDNLAYDLHISDCLSDLHPGDHVEIQWRRDKGFPYGWWYGVIGHLDTCDGNKHFCQCHLSDIVVLEFKQYTSESGWEQAFLNRKDLGEAGNETSGFYGGIRKLKNQDEISKWMQFWPSDVLD